MTKRVIKVFPDYCSSGLWDERGCNCSPDEFKISSGLQIGLEYWHDYWESNLVQWDDDGELVNVDVRYWNKWRQDGRTLIDAMNAENSEFTFVACFGRVETLSDYEDVKMPPDFVDEEDLIEASALPIGKFINIDHEGQ